MTPHPADDFLSRALVVPPDMDTARRRARLWLGIIALCFACIAATYGAVNSGACVEAVE